MPRILTVLKMTFSAEHQIAAAKISTSVDIFAEPAGKEVDDHSQAKKDNVKAAGAKNANHDNEEEKLVDELRKELAADKALVLTPHLLLSRSGSSEAF